MSKSNILEIPKQIQQGIDAYVADRIISDSDPKVTSESFKKVLAAYRYATKQYLSADYIANQRAPEIIADKVRKLPPTGKKLIGDNSTILLLFADPQFLMMLLVIFMTHAILNYTVLPNTQGFAYEDIPKSIWYTPMFVTRFIGNFFFFLFYFLIMMWAGLRKLVNPNCSIPITLTYIALMFAAIQGIFITYEAAAGGEQPELMDSINCFLSYMIPLVIFSVTPNIIDLIPSNFVRKDKKLPLIPPSKPNQTQYSLDFNRAASQYTSNEVFGAAIVFIFLYVLTAYSLAPFDPTLTTFVRGDLLQLIHRKDTVRPPAIDQEQLEKLTYAITYHVLVMLVVIISSVTMISQPTRAFNHSLFFSVMLPIGKLLIDLKYRSATLDFYGPFYDFFTTILRIMIPMTILTQMQSIQSTLSYIVHFDSNKPLPSWMVYSVIAAGILVFAIVTRSFSPVQKSPESVETFEDLEMTETTIEKLVTEFMHDLSTW